MDPNQQSTSLPPQEPHYQPAPAVPQSQPVQPAAPSYQPANNPVESVQRLAASNDPDPDGRDIHPMVVLQPGERMIATVKRHPFGIVSLYAGALFGMLVAGVGAALLPKLLEQYNITTISSTPIYAAGGLLILIILLILGVATMVYWQNQWIITTDSITQISQRGLFARQVSQLSMDNLEDVTVDQDGVVPHMFGFGTLKVETAGERSKFQFPYCPNPNEYARRILEVHEQFLEMRRNIQNTP